MNFVTLGMNLKRALVVIPLLGVAVNAQAGYNNPVSFAQGGIVNLTVGSHVGLFDHVLELNSSLGAVVPGPAAGNPLLVPLSSSIGRPTVLGFATASTGDTFSLGSFSSGQELIFRLSNIYGGGTYSSVDSQLFSGSASGLNPASGPNNIFTYVNYVSSTEIFVAFEDLFPWDPLDPSLSPASFLSAADVTFTLTLAPVPEPETYGMLLAGLGLLGFVARRRKQKAV